MAVASEDRHHLATTIPFLQVYMRTASPVFRSKWPQAAPLIWHFYICLLLHLFVRFCDGLSWYCCREWFSGVWSIDSANWQVVAIKHHSKSNANSMATRIEWWTFHGLYFRSVMVPANISKLFPSIRCHGPKSWVLLRGRIRFLFCVVRLKRGWISSAIFRGKLGIQEGPDGD